jgi:hypothetical protein
MYGFSPTTIRRSAEVIVAIDRIVQHFGAKA